VSYSIIEVCGVPMTYESFS